MNPKEQRVLWTTSTSHGLIHVYELAVPALLILIQAEFRADDFAMGKMVTLYGLLFGLGALPAGYLVDRFGSKRLLLGCQWGSALCLAGMAISPSLAWFAACAACMGLCLSIYHPAGTALITHAMPPSGRVFAIHGMIGNLGVAGSSAIAGSLGALLGWRWALGLLALFGIVIGLRLMALEVPDIHEVRRQAGRGQWPGFVLLLFAAAFMGMVYRGVTTFLPKFFAVHYAEDPSTGVALGGWLVTLSLLAGLLGMYVAGRMVDRGVRPVWVFLIGGVFQTPFLVGLGTFVGPVLLPLAMSLAFFHFFTQPPGNHMVAEFTPPRLRGLGFGIYFFVTFGTGSAGASLGGWVSDQVGLSYAFPAFAAILVPSILAILVLSRVSRVKPDPVRRASGSAG